MARGTYGTPMTIIRVPQRKPDPRRAKTCPRCGVSGGYPCMNGKARAPKIHRERYDPAAAAALERKRQQPKPVKKPKPGNLAAEQARLREVQERMRASANRNKPRP